MAMGFIRPYMPIARKNSFTDQEMIKQERKKKKIRREKKMQMIKEKKDDE